MQQLSRSDLLRCAFILGAAVPQPCRIRRTRLQDGVELQCTFSVLDTGIEWFDRLVSDEETENRERKCLVFTASRRFERGVSSSAQDPRVFVYSNVKSLTP